MSVRSSLVHLTVLLVAISPFLISCGDDDDPVASDSESGQEPAATEPADDEPESQDTTAEEGPEDGGDTAELQRFEADMATMNGSGVEGSATMAVSDDGTVTVTIDTSGYVDHSEPHAAHLHLGGRFECPPPEADADGDGFLTFAETRPAWGPIVVSLTTEGDMGTDSIFAIDRYPSTDAGRVAYERTFELPAGVTVDDLDDVVVVQHGFAGLEGDPALYDGERKSEVNPQVAFESSVPSACGAFSAV